MILFTFTAPNSQTSAVWDFIKNHRVVLTQRISTDHSTLQTEWQIIAPELVYLTLVLSVEGITPLGKDVYA